MLSNVGLRSNLSLLLTALHYGACVTIAASFLGASIVDLASLSTRRRKSGSASKRRWTAICLSAFIAITYGVQGVLFALDTLRHRNQTQGREPVVYVLLQLLTWTTLALSFFNSTNPRWSSFTTAWTTALLIEYSIVALSHDSQQDMDNSHNVHLAWQASRLAVLLMLSALGFSILLASRSEASGIEEQALIPSQCASNSLPAAAADYNYKSISDDMESNSFNSDVGDDGDSDGYETQEYLSEERRKRVQEEGGWASYVKEYSIFWPFIWPSHERKFKLYFITLGANILAERVLHVLYPRQFGIVIEKLYASISTGEIPWNDILLWAFYGVLSSGSAGLPAITEVLETRISNWSHLKLSVAAFDHVMGLSMSFHDGKDSGEVIRAVEQAGSLNSLLRTIVLDTSPVLMDLTIAAWYLTYLLDAFAVVILAFVMISFLFVTYYITGVLKQSRRVSAAKGRAESRILYEMVSNWSTVSYFNRRKHEQVQLSRTVMEATVANQWNSDVSLLLFVAEDWCQILGRFLVTILAAYRIAHGLIPVGNFVALQTYWDTITWPLWMLGHSYRQLASDLIDAERLLELFKQKSEIQDGPLTLESKLVKGKIEFSNVSFNYGKQRSVLEDFSFVAMPGQTIALVGATGSGKTSALKVLMRFYDVNAGSIMIDGHDVREVTVHSLREIFGFVPQNAALFNMSILENVRYGRLDATDEEVYQACRAAAIHDRILSFAEGYNTKVGERGVKVSGGELQRIAIARVLLKNPQIVLLDEATSALDTNTESQIQEALKNLTVGRTTIVIAHRLSTVTRADQILVVDQGRIVERGSHHELLSQEGRYVELWQKQTTVSPDQVMI